MAVAVATATAVWVLLLFAATGAAGCVLAALGAAVSGLAAFGARFGIRAGALAATVANRRGATSSHEHSHRDQRGHQGCFHMLTFRLSWIVFDFAQRHVAAQIFFVISGRTG
jgi:hypothetical protein